MITNNNQKSFRICLLVFFLVIAGVSSYAINFGQLVTPSSAKITLSEVGTIADFKFEVKKYLPYRFLLAFAYPENDQIERARIRKLLGGHEIDKNGMLLEPGIPTPVNIKILVICKDGKEIDIYTQDLDPILTSWGGSDFSKSIGEYVLTPGIYRLLLINKKSSPEFSSVPISLEIGTSAKTNFEPKTAPKLTTSCPQ